LAGSAFKDPETLKALANFTPILVDKDTDKAACAKFGEPLGPREEAIVFVFLGSSDRQFGETFNQF